MRSLLLVGLSLVLLGGCVRSIESDPAPGVRAEQPIPAGGSAGLTVASYFSPPKPSPGLEWTKDGRPVKLNEISSANGPDHCGWESAVFLRVGWPLGTMATQSTQTRLFVRDPFGVVEQALRERLVLHSAMPPDAIATGYRHGALELWLSQSNSDAAILRVGDDVERWPLAPDNLCK